MKKIRIGINGFGRIGRSLCRVIELSDNIEIVAINDLASLKNAAHLLKYDTTHSIFPAPIEVLENDILKFGNHTSYYSSHKNISDLDWKKYDLDFIVEATSLYRTKELLQGHLKLASKVILSAPPLDGIKTIVLGINEDEIDANDRIISNASCTTNSAAPLIKVINELCEIEHAFITTVHSYTSDQRIQDGPHKDFRRGRAAAESIVPTSTGAAKALTRIFPQFEGRIGGAGIRVPVPDGSLTDITFTVKNEVSLDLVHQAFLNASQNELKGILGYTNDPIVSRDIIGSSYSCLYDEELSAVLGRMLKVVGWYDNEMGYSSRLVDLLNYWSKL